MSDAIQVEELRKSFGEVVALDGLDLAAPEGDVLALLAPDGAGKPTRTIPGVCEPPAPATWPREPRSPRSRHPAPAECIFVPVWQRSPSTGRAAGVEC